MGCPALLFVGGEKRDRLPASGLGISVTYGDTSPQGRGSGETIPFAIFFRKFTALPRALPLGELANPQDLTERARLSEKGRRRPGENPPVKMLPQAVRRLSGTTKLK